MNLRFVSFFCTRILATYMAAATLLLEDGTRFTGTAIGAKGTAGGEICFNTGMTGYQEIYTDPSYYGQVVVNTTSHIGNYGTTVGENESGKVQISGLIVNDFSEVASRHNKTADLQQYLEQHKVVGIADIDTRKLVRHIREAGAMNCIISTDEGADLEKALKNLPDMKGLELASKVTTKEAYEWGDVEAEHRVAVLDIGLKFNSLRSLAERGCLCKIFPADTSFEEMEKWQPDGYWISNGPGDPAAMSYAVETVKEILDSNKPLFGICLGHQLLALACGLKTYKLHHGHRGINHPVKNLYSGKSEITSQNHGFSVDAEGFKNNSDVEVTHINLNDKTIAGLRHLQKPAFSVQYHPEAAPGPHDSRYLFDTFIGLLEEAKQLKA